MKTLKIRMTDGEKVWLEGRAIQNGRSMNSEIRQLLKKSMTGSPLLRRIEGGDS